MTDTLKTELATLGAVNLEDNCNYIAALYVNGKKDVARVLFGTLSRERQLDAMCYYASCFGGSDEFVPFISYLLNK